MRYLEQKMERLFEAKEEAEKWVHDAESRFPGEETVELEVQKSEIRKSLSNSLSNEEGVDAPAFDLGINPEKKETGSNIVQSKLSAQHSAIRQTGSQQTKDKGKRVVTFSPIPMTSYFDDAEETQL
ncbi:hypothetical protein L6452_41836 [Arctium lappa]|uniref:Uncharacterized protein n=1 Tax=Arctium lappa TaxID=4217 RepID=A0ACB8XGM4_ARCLA|nr:hypothetical protein L6452_41836 [Arctium lappa]